MIASARALLALILLAGLYLLTFVLIVLYLILGIGYLLLYMLNDYKAAGVSFPWQTVLITMGSAPLLWILISAVTTRVSVGPRPDSVLLSPEQAPRLWDLVRKLAERLDTTEPAEIRLVAEANASVTEDVKMLGLLPGYKRMYIGVPLLVGMPIEELRAVLCHELGHYARKHASFGVPAYRGSAALAAARKGLQRTTSVDRLAAMYGGLLQVAIVCYAALYDRLTLAVRRRLELEADAAAAAITGKAVTADALRSAHVLPAAWEAFLGQYVEPIRTATGTVPEDLFRAFQAMLDDPDVHNMLIDQRRCPPERPRSPYDSHPSLTRRLALLDRCPSVAEEHASGAAMELLDAAEQLFQDLCDTMPISRAASKLPCEEWLCLLAEHRATFPLKPLRGAVDAIYGRRWDGGTPALTLDEVLNLLEAGKSAELATALRTDRSQAEDAEQAPHQHLADAVYALVGQALVRAGAAQWLPGWIGRSRLMSRDATPEEIYDWVATAVRRSAHVSWLRLQLAALGIDVTAPVLPVKNTTNMRPITTVDPVDEATRREHKTAGKVALAVMVGTFSLLGLLYLMRGDDQPSYRYPYPYTPVNPTINPPFPPRSVPTYSQLPWPPPYLQPIPTLKPIPAVPK